MSILELILSIFVYLLDVLFSFIPTLSIPDSAITSIEYLFSLLSTIGFFLPLNTFAQVLIIWFSFYALRFSMSFFSFFLRKIPFINVK